MAETIRVLHVDDEPDFADLAATFLEREDERIAVEAATGAAEGLDRLADAGTEGTGDGIDCVVSDYDMPDRNGIEFLERVRAEYGDLPFVLFTGKGSEAVASDAIEAGVTHYLQKGTDPDQYALLANKVVNAVERRRVERARRRHLDAIESAREGIGILDEDGRFVYVNEAYADLYGYDPEEMLGGDLGLVHPDGQVADVRGDLLSHVREVSHWHGETVGLRADGSTFTEDHVLATTDDGGFVSTVTDVSDRKELTRNLRAVRRRLELALEETDTGVWEWNPDTGEVVWDETLERVMGLDPGAFEGTFEAFARRVHPDDIDDVREQAERAVREGGEYRAAFRMFHADGDVRWVHARGRVVDDGGDERMVGVHQDVTSLRERERAIEQLHEATRDLLGTEDREAAAVIAADAARDILGYSLNVVRLVDGAGERLLPVAVTSTARAQMGQRPVYPVDDSPVGEAYRTGESVLYGDIRDLDDGYDRGDARSVLYLPIGDHGTISIASTEVAEFDPADVELVRLLAANAAAALDRIEREREARAAEERYRTLVENFPDGGVFLFDEDLTYTLAGGTEIEAVGLSPDDFEGATPHDLFPDDLADELADYYRRALAGEAHTFEQEYRGSHYRIQTLPVRDDASDVVAGMAVAQDVTERTERERDLRRYKHMVNAMQEAACIYDAEGRFEVVNDRLAWFYDTTRAALEGESSTLIPQIRADAEGDPYQELLDGERAELRGEIESEFPGSGRVILEYRLTPLLIDGEVEGVVGIARDVTQRKDYQTRIEGLHRATRELMAATTERKIAERTAEAAGTTLDFPLTVVRFLDDEGLVPVAISEDDVDLDDTRPVYGVGQPTAGLAFEKGETVVYDDVGVVDDDIDRAPGGSMYVPIGEYGVMSVTGTEPDAFDDADVDAAEILAANAEAALDRVARSQRLREQNERLEEFVGVVSHDLRNPLNVIEGRLALARRECDSEHLDSAVDALGRSQKLVGDLLALARGGERTGELERVALADAIERSRRHVRTDGATIAVDAAQVIRADPSRLQQLLENLLRNCVEHGSSDDRAEADAEADGPTGHDPHVTVDDLDGGFYVADDGPGIPESERGRVFDVDYSTSERGTGFGLRIVEEICDAHGWDVRVVESEDGGARFEITGVDVVE
ncbi:MAG: PAS domain S-box protein [Haloferacaceae archaeon]